jgi:flagellar protein FlbT
MNITLRAGEKLYINGAVIRVDRKATIELLNDVTFLLENHVMQVDQATSPLRQIYFAVQVALMDPGARRSRNFEALKTLRALFPLEESEMVNAASSPPQHAA